MSQIPLSLRKKLSYSPENFIWHQGVKDIHKEIFKEQSKKIFRPYFVHGASRSGKTHLCFAIAERCRVNEVSVKIISGHQQFVQYLKKEKLQEDEFIIFDAAEETLKELTPEGSAPMIDLYEQAKSAGKTLLIASSRHYTSANLDQHLLSRFDLMTPMQIGDPADSEVIDLISTLAMQRGIKLKDHQLSFLAPRLPKVLAEVEQFLERLSYLAVSSNSSINRNTISKAL